VEEQEDQFLYLPVSAVVFACQNQFSPTSCQETMRGLDDRRRRPECFAASFSAYDSRGEDAQQNDGTQNKQTNSVASVRERTIPTERPPLLGEVYSNF
jgi:hypothetical protein